METAPQSYMGNIYQANLPHLEGRRRRDLDCFRKEHWNRYHRARNWQQFPIQMTDAIPPWIQCLPIHLGLGSASEPKNGKYKAYSVDEMLESNAIAFGGEVALKEFEG